MPYSTANQPFKEFRARGLTVTIWQNESTTRDGQPIMRHSVTLNKRYRDQQTGEWKDSNSFFPDDLPRLRLLIEKAYELILLTPRQDTEPSERNGIDTSTE